MIQYLDKCGRQISESKWNQLITDKFYRVVAQQYVGDHFVSTIWLGVPSGPFGIYIFETVIFAPNEKNWRTDRAIETIRYETLEEAVNGHSEAIKRSYEEVCA